MRRRFLFFLLVVVAVSVTAKAWSSGPPASTVVSGDGCTCHSGSPNSGTAVSVEAPPAYGVGQSYTIKVSSTTDVTSIGVNKGGFLAWASAGSFEKPTANADWYQIEQLEGKSVIKHTTAGDQGNTAQAWEFKWKAPASAAGAVQIKVWANRVNGDGSASDLDHWNRKHVTIAAPGASTTTNPSPTTTRPTTSAASPTTPSKTTPTTAAQDEPGLGLVGVAAAVCVALLWVRGRRPG